MAVVVSGTMVGTLEGGAAPVTLRCAVDRDLAQAIAKNVRGANVPMVGVSYGANDAAAAVMPMDWGTQVPLHCMRATRSRRLPPRPANASRSSRAAITAMRTTRRDRMATARRRRCSMTVSWSS